MMRKMGVRIGAAVLAGGVVSFLGAASVSAGAVPPISVTATAECDGTVTGSFTFELEGNQTLDNVEMTFAAGAVSVTEALGSSPSSPDPQTATGTATATGFAVGDIVVVDVSGTFNPAEVGAVGTATVEIPECPGATDAPVVTDPPVDTEAPVDTDAPSVTEAPTETDAPTPTPVQTTPPPATLPATGSGSRPAGLVAGVLLAAGVAMVVFATRRQADGTSR